VTDLRVETAGDAMVLTIDRPAVRNAIDRGLARRLGEAVRIASLDPRVRGVVIAAEGADTFVSGGDLRELAELSKGEGSGGREVLDMIDDLSACETCDVPVVAAVQGAVLGGGCELLLLCDLVVMEEHATLSFRHAKMGLSPAWGGATRLIERAGPLEAARLLFTAERIVAREALRIGLVNEVVPRGSARARAIARVARIADNPRSTVAALKRALREVRAARRGDALDRERDVFSERWGGGDHRQAMDAFLGRKP
jgi:enoyl-CoA hydratase/carnithine racemase